MPMDFFKTYGMDRFIEHFWKRPNEDDGYYFFFSLSGKPRYNVLHFYLLFDKQVRYRANIIKVEGESTKVLGPGRTMYGRAWVFVGAPVIKAPHVIPMTGFQGFRYTEGIF